MTTLDSMISNVERLVMKTLPRVAIALLVALVPATIGLAQEKPAVTQLAFLAGTWRGTSSSGATAEELISTPEGGVMVCAGREFKDGKCVFYDLVVFTTKDGTLALIPHPNGKRSPHSFPLAKLDLAAKRAIFENKEHDFPKTFTYELTAPDRLRLTLVGETEGKATTEVYELARVK